MRRKSSSPHPSPPHQPASSSLFCIVFILHLLKISVEERFNPISAGVGWGGSGDSFLIAMLQSASQCRPPVATCPVLNTFSLITAQGND